MRYSTTWRDMLTFRYMLLPGLIQVIFWLGLVICLLTVSIDWWQGRIIQGLLVLVLGPLLLRLACEAMILLFQLNNTLYRIWRDQQPDQHSQSS